MNRNFIDKVSKDLFSWGVEFWMHVAVTMFVCLIVAIVLRLSGVGHEAVGVIAGVVGLLVGAGKEFFDKKTGGEWSLMDFIGDFWGMIAFMLAHFV